MDFQVSMLQPNSAERTVEADGDGQPHRVNLAIIGGGPSGLTAALYASRGGHSPVVFVGNIPGGQISSTERVENFPGFPDGVNGAELAQRMVEQVQHFDVTIVQQGVKSVDFSGYPLELRTSSDVYYASAVIVATGAFPRKLGVPGESEFFGRGVSTCATCDGFFYRDRRVVVVGGGDSAIEEGLFLTKFASEVVVIHRRDQLRASKILQERAFETPKMRFVWDSVVEEISGEQTVAGVNVRNVKTGAVSQIDTDGVFVYVGLIPATKIFKNQLEMDEGGYIITDRRGRTSAQGVYAAGDVQNPNFRQAVIAAGSGAAVAMEVERYIAERDHMAKSDHQA
ncbi:MAG: thioredoxin-disulfide reductase [Anaerolineae bacterium]|nr:thioredoxin-disulfide reductase [Anaerolineae bacterium]